MNVRALGRFILNAALPETLIESELFGHQKGAFTGASERRVDFYPVTKPRRFVQRHRLTAIYSDGGAFSVDPSREVLLARARSLALSVRFTDPFYDVDVPASPRLLHARDPLRAKHRQTPDELFHSIAQTKSAVK